MKNNKYICGSCGEHTNKVTFDEDRDTDLCDSCNEALNSAQKEIRTAK